MENPEGNACAFPSGAGVNPGEGKGEKKAAMRAYPLMPESVKPDMM